MLIDNNGQKREATAPMEAADVVAAAADATIPVVAPPVSPVAATADLEMSAGDPTAPPLAGAAGVVGRFLNGLLEKAIAARGARGLTPADVRELRWAANNVGEPGFFDDLTAEPAAATDRG